MGGFWWSFVTVGGGEGERWGLMGLIKIFEEGGSVECGVRWGECECTLSGLLENHVKWAGFCRISRELMG